MVLEDNPSAASVIKYLSDHGYKVWHARSLLDVAYFLEEDPCLEIFDKLMFDAQVPIEEFPFMGKKAKKYGEKYGFSGFEFVTENYELLKSKSLAMITAFNIQLYNDLKDDPIEGNIFKELTIIDKSSDDFMRQMLDFLNS